MLRVAKFAEISIKEAWEMPYTIFIQTLRVRAFEDELAGDRLMQGYDFLAQQIAILTNAPKSYKAYAKIKTEAQQAMIAAKHSEHEKDLEKARMAAIFLSFDGSINPDIVNAVDDLEDWQGESG